MKKSVLKFALSLCMFSAITAFAQEVPPPTPNRFIRNMVNELELKQEQMEPLIQIVQNHVLQIQSIRKDIKDTLSLVYKTKVNKSIRGTDSLIMQLIFPHQVEQYKQYKSKVTLLVKGEMEQVLKSQLHQKNTELAKQAKVKGQKLKLSSELPKMDLLIDPFTY